MITNIELLMCNLMAILLLRAVSELNYSVHLRLRNCPGPIADRVHTAAVATHTCQDEPESFFPIGIIFVLQSHNFCSESEISDSRCIHM